MRFLRLDFRDDLNSIDFHPLLTVVSSLAPEQRRQLFEAVRRLSSGSTVGLRGLVEHQGLMLELDATSGEPLGPATTTAAVLVFVDGVAIRQDRIGLQAEIDQWERQATIDAVAVEEIRSNLDLAVRAKAYNLCRLADPNGTDGAGRGGTPRRLKVETIRRAYEEVNGHERLIAQCDPEILTLLERWNAHLELVANSEDHLEKVAGEVRVAERRVKEHEAELSAAKAAAVPVLLNAEQESRLETLTDLRNEISRDSSRRGKRKRTMTDEEEAERQRLLDMVGVKSWTEYSVFRLSPTVSPEKLQAVEDATTSLARATDALEQARQRQGRDEVAATLQQNLEQIKRDAEPFLGVLVPSDIGAALQRQIAQVDNPDWVTAVNDLRDALSSNDLHPPYGFEPNEILGWTDSWLRAQESLEVSGQAPTDSENDEEQAGGESLLVQIADARRSLIRHDRALAQIDRAERAAVRSAMRVRDLKNQLRVRSAEPEATTAAEVVTMVKSVTDRVLQDIQGSVPIAVVGEMSGLSDLEAEVLMSRLETIAAQVQIILVSGHPALATWVDHAGLQRASLTDGSRALI